LPRPALGVQLAGEVMNMDQDKTAAVIHCFTGTGNSAQVASVLQDGLTRAGRRVETRMIEAGAKPAAGEFGLCVLIFPVYAFSMPQIVAAYARRLPRAPGARAAVIAMIGATKDQAHGRGRHGGYEGRALEQARTILKRRGYDVFLTDAISHVHNFTEVAPCPKDRTREAIAQEALSRMNAILARIVHEDRGIKPCGPAAKVVCAIVGASYRIFGRRIAGKLFVADASCNGCALCARRCPAASISMIGHRPRWNLSCQGCQRCINLCPQKAIQTSGLRLACYLLPLLVPYWAIFRVLLPDLDFLGKPANVALNVVFYVVGFHVTVLVLDHVIALAERFKVLAPVTQLSWTRKFRRYMQPDFRKKM
jgi:Pyruvate/2-oxoacid:ferredoxin oxidoreductase delta subunit